MRRVAIMALLALMLIPQAVRAEYCPTLDSLRAAVRQALGEDNKDRWPDSVLTTFVNEAQIRVAIDCGAYRKKDTITTTMGVTFYAANADAIEGWPIDVIGYDPSLSDIKARWWGLRWLLPKDWAASSDEDKNTFFTGYVSAGEIAVYPPPATSDGSLYIYYRALPPALETDTSRTVIPETDRPAIVSYAAKRAAESLSWDTMGALQTAEYDRHINARQMDMVAPRYDVVGKSGQGGGGQ